MMFFFCILDCVLHDYYVVLLKHKSTEYFFTRHFHYVTCFSWIFRYSLLRNYCEESPLIFSLVILLIVPRGINTLVMLLHKFTIPINFFNFERENIPFSGRFFLIFHECFHNYLNSLLNWKVPKKLQFNLHPITTFNI